MERKYVRTWAAAGCTVLLLSGCAKTKSVQPVRNVERAVTLWDDSAHMCLEYATPAHELDNQKGGLTVPVGEQIVTLSYENSESLASIYSVSEIMQFGHASLYRLCEAGGNKSINPDTYKELFNSTLEKVHGLIELQLLRQRMNTAERLVLARADLATLDDERCTLAAKTSAADKRALREKTERRRRMVEEIEQLESVLGVKYQVALPSEAVPDAEWQERVKNAQIDLEKALTDIPGNSIAAQQAEVVTVDKKSGALGAVDTKTRSAGKNWKTACSNLSALSTGACVTDEAMLERCPW